MSIYNQHLDKVSANYEALSPLTLIERAAMVYPERISVVHGDLQFTWAETYKRCRQLASALKKIGIQTDDTIAVMAPNVPALYEAHFGVAMAGAVLNALNIRLDAATIAFILEHGEAKVLITDKEFSPTIKAALALLKSPPIVIDIDDPWGNGGELLGAQTYEQFINQGDPDFSWQGPEDEWQAISLNYTSGTTGDPKGVVYHHRGAFLNAMNNIVGWDMGDQPVYLWTLPMFHCNGWCFPWTMAAVAGTNICLRNVTAKGIFDGIADHKVDHFCGAPIVLNMMVNASDEDRREYDHQVKAMTAGAAPPAAILSAMESDGFQMTHVYGLTETYGPAVMCAWKTEWDELSQDDRAQMKARQGVRYLSLAGLQVMDPDTMVSVPANGETTGEVMFRGNLVMKGYLKNPETTDKAFVGGWFHSGDLAVMYPDGYIKIKDRSKDIIISGGENISSLEIEDVLYRHPAVLEASVVAKPDEKWGETPCVFVTLKDTSQDTTVDEIMSHCKDNLASFKVPKTVIFGSLPKTSTGKIQKFKLREQLNDLSD